MKNTIIHLCLAIVLSWSFSTALGDDPGNNVNQSAAHIYRHAKYGFQFAVPAGWMVRETNYYFPNYSRVFLTVNNQRSDLAIRDQRTGSSTREFSAETTLQQMQPGEVYVYFSHFEGLDDRRADSVGSNLDSILSTNRITTSSQPGLSYLVLSFSKRGHWWNIFVDMRDPVTEENRSTVMGLLKSFRFVDAPVGEASWAGSLAWKELPDNIRTFESPYGWPAVGGRMEQRSVVVGEKDSGYSVKFIQEDVGEWEYLVSADGKVQAEPPLVHALSPPPAQLPSELPGKGKGLVDAYWIAPYVHVSKAFGKPNVTWFARDGTIKHQAAVNHIGDNTSMVTLTATNGPVVRAINEDWQITPHTNTTDAYSGFIGSTPDSRVFFDAFSSQPGLVALDIYIHGRRVNTLGPFIPCSTSSEVAMNDDGSSALLVWKDDSKTNIQIVALNTNGTLQFQVDCGGYVWNPSVAPDAAGVLVRSNTNQNRYMWFTRQGEMHSMVIIPNPECLGWIPESRKSVFYLGDKDPRFQLIDWDAGKRLWDIPSPVEGQLLAFGLTSELILLDIAQPYYPASRQKAGTPNSDSGKEWIKTFYAINVHDGSLAAQWQAPLPHRSFNKNRDRFLKLDGKLFFITDNEFTEFNLKDIISKRNGWK